MNSIRDKAGQVESSLEFAYALADMGVPIFCGLIDDEGNPDTLHDRRWINWHQTKPGISRLSGYKPGDAVCAVGGRTQDFIDYDPRNDASGVGLLWFKKHMGGLRPVWTADTPSGGKHNGIPALGLRKCKPAPGVDYQGGSPDGSGRGFVFISPTVRPSKVSGRLGLYTPLFTAGASPVSEFAGLRTAIQQSVAERGVDEGGRHSLVALAERVRSAEYGSQRDAVLAYVSELEKLGVPRASIPELVLSIGIPSLSARPWSVSDIRGTMHRAGRIVPDATDEERTVLASRIMPVRAEPREEKEFWDAHEVLRHIHAWARSRRAAPWAVLGEAMAEAVCHTAPTLQLPSLIGGNGSLNMLMAVTGRSGAGKDAAAATCKAAFKWEGILGIINDVVDRIPVGSGEGLVRSYGYTVMEDGQRVLRRVAESCIVTITEIDTLAALGSRSGATLVPQLRQFYNGQTLGFGYGDPSKRVIIPEHSYRGCVVAGVQPGRGSVILDDVDGGFAQRWLWLPAGDPYAPSSVVASGSRLRWCPPDIDWEEVSVSVMPCCESIRDETDEIRIGTLHETSGDMESHRNYTRIKVAASLALLMGGWSIDDFHWELSCYIMSVSDRCRAGVGAALEEKAAVAAEKTGRVEGVKMAAARSSEGDARVSANVLGKLSRVWMSHSVLKNKIAARDRELLNGVLCSLLDSGRIEDRKVVHGQAGVQYRLKRG